MQTCCLRCSTCVKSNLFSFTGCQTLSTPARDSVSVLMKGSFSCFGPFGILGHVAFVLISGWKWWEKLTKQDGPEGPVLLLPSKCSWHYGHIFDIVPVDEEAVMAIIWANCVLWLDETCEELDVGVV